MQLPHYVDLKQIDHINLDVQNERVVSSSSCQEETIILIDDRTVVHLTKLDKDLNGYLAQSIFIDILKVRQYQLDLKVKLHSILHW